MLHLNPKDRPEYHRWERGVIMASEIERLEKVSGLTHSQVAAVLKIQSNEYKLLKTGKRVVKGILIHSLLEWRRSLLIQCASDAARGFAGADDRNNLFVWWKTFLPLSLGEFAAWNHAWDQTTTFGWINAVRATARLAATLDYERSPLRFLRLYLAVHPTSMTAFCIRAGIPPDSDVPRESRGFFEKHQVILEKDAPERQVSLFGAWESLFSCSSLPGKVAGE